MVFRLEPRLPCGLIEIGPLKWNNIQGDVGDFAGEMKNSLGKLEKCFAKRTESAVDLAKPKDKITKTKLPHDK